MKRLWSFLYHFFPVQLLFLHFRRSLLLLSFWIVLFGLTGGWFFKSIGIPYLFEMPEYLGEISFISYLIMGVLLGFFVMAFHIASYIFYSYRFTFLATLSKPLYRFSINNSIIPILYFVFYGFIIADSLSTEGYPVGQIMLNEIAVLLGSVLSIMLTYTYFFSTIKSPKGQTGEMKLPKPFRLIINKEKKLEKTTEDELVFTYLRNFYSIRVARRSGHYDDEERLKTLQQHHTHAAIYFVGLLVLLVVLSLFSSVSFFLIPAGASVVLILTTYLMIFGALYSWLKTWTTSVLLIGAVIINYISGFPNFQRQHMAAGLDYESEYLPYTYQAIDAIVTDSIVDYDKQAMIAALNGWKSRQDEAKPKLVLFNSSGGGMRSSLFSLGTMQYIDSVTSGQFHKKLFLITGSSGGMIGAAYYRELNLKRDQGELMAINSRSFYNLLGDDILNAVGFTMAVNDLFIPIKSFDKAGFKYRVSRGTAWDDRFNKNTGSILNKPVISYRSQEQSGQIPLIVLAPSIINSGQRLLISPMGLSFFSKHVNSFQTRSSDLYDGVEYARFFKSRQGDSLSFVTALRLSSTFPYITPIVALPTTPQMEVVDAGARDNDGMLLTLRFLYLFQDWIEENTSGVVIVQALADRPVEAEIKESAFKTRMESLLKPVGAMVQSFGTLQGYTRAEMLSYAAEWIDFPLSVVRFDLLTKSNEISLSWHLTEREKDGIYRAVRAERLQDDYQKLIENIK